MTPRRPILPKGVWFASKTLASGERVRFGYLGRGPGTVALGREGSPAFHQALADALNRLPPEGRMAGLIYAYRTSRSFKKLAPRTQADYLAQLDKISAKFGALSLGAMQAPRMAEMIERWRDQMDASPRQADYAATVLGVVLAWGVRRGKLSHNRAAGLEKLYRADRASKVWAPEDVAAFLAVAPEPIARALTIAVETGASQGDLLRLCWNADRGTVLDGRRGKTNVPFAVPISPELRRCLDGVPRGPALTILTKADGLPWEPKGNGFRQAWRDAATAAGIAELTFNDLRGTFITRRRTMGWTAEEVALCSGHPIAVEEKGAQKSYADRAPIALANAQRLHARWYAEQAVAETCKPDGKPAGGVRG